VSAAFNAHLAIVMYQLALLKIRPDDSMESHTSREENHSWVWVDESQSNEHQHSRQIQRMANLGIDAISCKVGGMFAPHIGRRVDGDHCRGPLCYQWTQEHERNTVNEHGPIDTLKRTDEIQPVPIVHGQQCEQETDDACPLEQTRIGITTPPVNDAILHTLGGQT